MGTLYVVGTPIGNLEDISLRALRVLGEVGVVAAEDTRMTRKLLTRHGIQAALVSFHEHTAPDRRAALVQRLDAADMALVTDAGTPGVSDPGAELVREAVEAGHEVVPVPGPSAVTTALSVAAMPADSYLFIGFMPRRHKDRRSLLESVAAEGRTLVAFEAPHRVVASLVDMRDALGDRDLAVARELTKVHEELWRGTLSEAVENWSHVEPRGEFTLVVAGADTVEAAPWSDEEVTLALIDLRAEGLSAREASKRLAGSASRPAREIYRLWHQENTPDSEEKNDDG